MGVAEYLRALLGSLPSPVEPTPLSTPPTDPKDQKAARKAVLQNRITKYQDRRRRNWRTRRLLQIAGAVSLIASLVIFTSLKGSAGNYGPYSLTVGMLIAVGFWASSFAFTPYEFELEIRQTEDEIELVDTPASREEQAAQKLFKLHQLELNKYYDQTLKQSRWIFFAGLFCLFLGFGVIAITLWIVRDVTNKNAQFAAILGGIAGILSNFIGAVYLKMHSETIKSLTEFHNRLVNTHYLHFGNFLLAKIEKVELREESLAKIAVNLSTNEKHGPVAKPPKAAGPRVRKNPSPPKPPGDHSINDRAG
jgi:putative flippase GtrA